VQSGLQTAASQAAKSFINGSSLGAVTSPPFNLTTALLEASTHALTAKASARTSLFATSAPVNIPAVAPVATSNNVPRVINGQFAIDHTANPGLRYVVEGTVIRRSANYWTKRKKRWEFVIGNG